MAEVKKVEESATTLTNHVVLFKMPETFTVEVEKQAAEQCAEFVGNIPGVLSSTFGRTFTTEFAKDFTHVLVVVFAHPSHLSTYGPHEIHQKWAGKFVNPFKLDILKVDIDAAVHSSKI
jgi:hypothetical protein